MPSTVARDYALPPTVEEEMHVAVNDE